MKKTIIVLAIVLTSGIAALALSLNKTTELKTAQIKADRTELMKGHEFGSSKSDIATAD